jgi:hypothetical protein
MIAAFGSKREERPAALRERLAFFFFRGTRLFSRPYIELMLLVFPSPVPQRIAPGPHSRDSSQTG